eukprot:UN18121
MVPKMFLLKSMISMLSNAVSDIFFGWLNAFVNRCEF